MAMPSKYELIASGTAGDNVAGNSGVLDVREFDSIGYRIGLVGGVAPAAVNNTLTGYDTDGITVVTDKGAVISTGAVSASGTWGPGCTGTNSGGVQHAAPLPAKIKLTYSAMGVGISTTWVVYGRRNHRGPDVSANPD